MKIVLLALASLSAVMAIPCTPGVDCLEKRNEDSAGSQNLYRRQGAAGMMGAQGMGGQGMMSQGMAGQGMGGADMLGGGGGAGMMPQGRSMDQSAMFGGAQGMPQ